MFEIDPRILDFYYYVCLVSRYTKHAVLFFYTHVGLVPAIGPLLQLLLLLLAWMIFYFNCPVFIRTLIFLCVRCLVRAIIWLTPGAGEVLDEIIAVLRDWAVSLAAHLTETLLTYPTQLWGWSI